MYDRPWGLGYKAGLQVSFVIYDMLILVYMVLIRLVLAAAADRMSELLRWLTVPQCGAATWPHMSSVTGWSNFKRAARPAVVPVDSVQKV